MGIKICEDRSRWLYSLGSKWDYCCRQHQMPAHSLKASGYTSEKPDLFFTFLSVKVTRFFKAKTQLPCYSASGHSFSIEASFQAFVCILPDHIWTCFQTFTLQRKQTNKSHVHLDLDPQLPDTSWSWQIVTWAHCQVSGIVPSSPVWGSTDISCRVTVVCVQTWLL